MALHVKIKHNRREGYGICFSYSSHESFYEMSFYSVFRQIHGLLFCRCICFWRIVLGDSIRNINLKTICTVLKCLPLFSGAPSIYREYQGPVSISERRLFLRSRKVSKPRDWYFKLSYRFEMWQAHRQHCSRSACQISERSDNSKHKSRGFETLRDLTGRRLFWYWDGALVGYNGTEIRAWIRHNTHLKVRCNYSSMTLIYR